MGQSQVVLKNENENRWMDILVTQQRARGKVLLIIHQCFSLAYNRISDKTASVQESEECMETLSFRAF